MSAFGTDVGHLDHRIGSQRPRDGKIPILNVRRFSVRRKNRAGKIDAIYIRQPVGCTAEADSLLGSLRNQVWRVPGEGLCKTGIERRQSDGAAEIGHRLPVLTGQRNMGDSVASANDEGVQPKHMRSIGKAEARLEIRPINGRHKDRVPGNAAIGEGHDGHGTDGGREVQRSAAASDEADARKCDGAPGRVQDRKVLGF